MMRSVFSKTRGWQDSKCDGSVYLGEWLRLTLYNIDGFANDEWFFSCTALDIDTFQLKAKDREAAKLEALKLAVSMSRRYRTDLAKARFGLADDGFRTTQATMPLPGTEAKGE